MIYSGFPTQSRRLWFPPKWKQTTFTRQLETQSFPANGDELRGISQDPKTLGNTDWSEPFTPPMDTKETPPPPTDTIYDMVKTLADEVAKARKREKKPHPEGLVPRLVREAVGDYEWPEDITTKRLVSWVCRQLGKRKKDWGHIVTVGTPESPPRTRRQHKQG